MALFQSSILKKHLKVTDNEISDAYKQYTSYFHNPDIQENIQNSKEEQFQEGFLRELFVKILGYTLNPEPNFNLITEKKNEAGSKKADGAILVNGEVVGIIELKDGSKLQLNGKEVYLHDLKRNKIHNLTVAAYKFTNTSGDVSANGDLAGRFQLVFKDSNSPTAIDGVDFNGQIIVSAANNELRAVSLVEGNPIESVAIYTVLVQLLFQKSDLNMVTWAMPFPANERVVVMKVQSGMNTKTVKLVRTK